MRPKSGVVGVTFRYLPGFLPMTIGLGIFFIYGSYLLVTDRTVLSPKGIFLLVLAIAGNLVLWSLIVTLWQTYWNFIFTPTHLIAVHRLRSKRVEVPWEAIVRVRKLPRAWWGRGGRGGFNQIETAEGQTIPVGVHLLRYKQFLEELRARAINCQVFDPYRSEWDQ